MVEVVLVEQKKRLVHSLLLRNLLLPPSLLAKLDEGSVSRLITRMEDTSQPPVSSVLELVKVLQASSVVMPSSSVELDAEASLVHGHTHATQAVSIVVDVTEDDASRRAALMSGEFKVQVISDYGEKAKKRETTDFVSFYNARFTALEKILRSHGELANVVSIARVVQKRGRESVAVIAMVLEKVVTPNTQAIILTIEDKTGVMKVMFTKKNMEVYALAKDVCEDEVIGILGMSSDNGDKPMLFGNAIVLPDVPLTKELKKAPMDHPGMAAFITDIHVGSKQFMEENFKRFVSWIKGDAGTQSQRELATKVKYLFVGGDLVDGVGIYPGQEEDLAIKDIYAQYRRIADLIANIPDHIKIMIIPGNHDAMRLNEPQPSLYRDICRPIWDLKNAILVSNPSVINIHATPDFIGFDFLMYHGYSFDYYVAHVDSIRLSGGYERADLIMKYLLQRRHLAPTNLSTPLIPDPLRDPLVIEKVPDFFLTGHIHRTKVASYRNVTMINGGCWQDITSFQVKTGHNPEPCRVSLIDLQTREVKLLRF